MNVARATRLLALGVLMSLMIAAGAGAVLLGLLLAPVLATGATAGVVIFRLPRWVFRALTVPGAVGAPAPAALARAWWAQPHG